MSRFDNIEDLPTDEKTPDVNELYLVNTLFSNNNNSAMLFNGFKDTIAVGFLFILLNMPFINSLIKKIFKFTAGSHILFILIKSIILMILYFVIINFALSKDNSI
tara:strand:+ start:190 stop:504 length:315 start_codon:yes stop_codon:yes gene_type:complete